MNNLGIIDIVYLVVVVLFITIGAVCLWRKANRKRKHSVDEYLMEKEQRKKLFENSTRRQ